MVPKESLRDLHTKFIDEEQRLVQDIVASRLADDRDQDECRYLLRFAWELFQPYQVTELELEQHLAEAKLRAIRELIRAIRRSPADIDIWITTTLDAWPVVQDRSFQLREQAHRRRVAAERPAGEGIDTVQRDPRPAPAGDSTARSCHDG